MKRLKNSVVLFALICSVLLLSNTANAKSYGELSQVEYIRTIDGDSIVFNIPGVHPILGENISIRIRGLDAPEIRGKCKEEKILALKAKSYVEVAMKRAIFITLDNIERGKYFRIVADVMITDRYNERLNIAPLLIKSGLAVPYDGGSKDLNIWCGE